MYMKYIKVDFTKKEIAQNILIFYASHELQGILLIL